MNLISKLYFHYKQLPHIPFINFGVHCIYSEDGVTTKYTRELFRIRILKLTNFYFGLE